jgi:phosphoribosylformylglycinamidine cyclo-ligase
VRESAIAPTEAWEVFNMGVGLVAAVPAAHAEQAAATLAAHHPGARVIGEVTDRAGEAIVPDQGVRIT